MAECAGVDGGEPTSGKSLRPAVSLLRIAAALDEADGQRPKKPKAKR